MIDPIEPDPNRDVLTIIIAIAGFIMWLLCMLGILVLGQ